MNTLQMIWSALTTQNEQLIKILLMPLTYLDVYICMLYFTTILNIHVKSKHKLIYVLLYGTVGNLITFLVPASCQVYINLIIWPLMIFFIFKTSLLKSILSVVITMVTTFMLDFTFTQIIQNILDQPFSIAIEIPIYRLSIALSIYALIFIFSKIIKYIKFHISFFENMNNKTRIILFVNLLLLLLILEMQFYLTAFYSDSLPFYISLCSTIGLIAYFIVSIYSLLNAAKLAYTKIELENSQHMLHTTKILHDQVRSFKHDFDNIVNSIGGYVVSEDLDGLKVYYKQLLEECNKTNNLYALSPEVINHPSIYHMLATKYYEADKKGILIKLNVFMDLNEIENRMKIYDFTRILGILLDNAIEASQECTNKIINVTFRKDSNNNMLLVIIQNTYNNKDIDTESIFQKGETSKENHSGLGLWKVREILMHNNNLNLYTTKNDLFFTQQFEIFK